MVCLWASTYMNGMCMHTCVHMFMCTDIWMSTCIYVWLYMYVCIYEYTCACVGMCNEWHVFICPYMFMCVNGVFAYACIHGFVHTCIYMSWLI